MASYENRDYAPSRFGSSLKSPSESNLVPSFSPSPMAGGATYLKDTGQSRKEGAKDSAPFDFDYTISPFANTTKFVDKKNIVKTSFENADDIGRAPDAVSDNSLGPVQSMRMKRVRSISRLEDAAQ